MILAFVLLLGFAITLIFVGGCFTAKNDVGLGCVLLVLGSLFLYLVAMTWLQYDHSSEYYLPCEIVAVNETSTYFGTVDQDTVQIYAVETGDHDWPDDVPYLLHMDKMGTKDVTDDEVLMVWRADR